MIRHAFSFLLLSAGLLMGSCGHSDSVTDRITSAELAMANDNVSATREICQDIFQEHDRTAIEASQMARMSILYMQLNERTDDPEDVELAVQCFREAYKINADSATAFYKALPVDQDKYAMTLATIVHTLDNPQEIPADHDIDLDSAEMEAVEADMKCGADGNQH